MRVVSFKVDEELLEVLEEYARRKNITKSEIIRRALRNYIMNTNDKPFITRRIKIYS
ncbi:MAG: ribbon-helix-helix protein, CopG family [Desulfurococcales archaeon]|nr:ribbon-helix-helix protein, CopG family [Desulfurococcales archaeon]MEB3760164.1 ribbon-helix-helix protein, CopG family [Desulfurococcales archaeon]MEB3765884.1 ribbon-helix-helix protein, CopG family [Desulfurococcales archaeon]MEB3789583.1 ribbon-helix-helix protein, CopG family [Desulfurococcales archaeon]